MANKLLAVGCSFLMPRKGVIPQVQVMADSLDYKLVNRSIAGNGNQHIVYHVINEVQKHDYALVCIGWSNPGRWDYITRSNKWFAHKVINFIDDINKDIDLEQTFKMQWCPQVIMLTEYLKSNDCVNDIHSSEIVPGKIKLVLDAFSNIGRHVFVDAGATLSWSYQALNLGKRLGLEMYTGFNLHPMGWANCAQIGAAHANPRAVSLCIIGDGSLPMNMQELAAMRPQDKLMIVDNGGYGIIRQTQRQYYQRNFSGSSFDHPKSPLPRFDTKSLVKAFIKENRILELNERALNDKSVEMFMDDDIQVLILKVAEDHEVITDFYEY